MSEFQLYIELGFKHITDYKGIDHMLFLLALSVIFTFKHWKRVLWLVTLFTLGHSITLVLASTGVVHVNYGLIEFLIPLTILITGLFDLTKAGQDPKSNVKLVFALVFGLIHGLGFSNYFRMISSSSNDYFNTLVPFTLGIELGQILVVLIILALSLAVTNVSRLKTKDWSTFVSGIVCGLAIYFMINTWPF